MSDSGHCSIVGLEGIMIQLMLGFVSFSVLIIKRNCEHPKRPLKIWFHDTLKQVISQLVAHFLNLIISLALNESQPTSDTCLWYVITNIFDNTFGVFLSVMILRKIEKQFLKRRQTHLISGYYYQIIEEKEKNNQQIEPQGKQQLEQQIELTKQIVIINYKAWFMQLCLWNTVFIISKILVFVSQFFLRQVLDTLSHFLLGWIQAYPDLELFVVIVFIPVIMNGFAFWIVDNFLKKRDISSQINQIQNQEQIGEVPGKQKFSSEQMKKKDNQNQEVNMSPQK